MNVFARENNLNKGSENYFLDMPRWQRGYATGCRPVYGSSNIGSMYPSLSLLPNQFVKVNLPRGSKILFMFSGGIDSPVGMLIAKRKFEVTPIHFLLTEFYPSGYKENIIEILEKIKDKIKFRKFYVVEFSEVLRTIVEKTNKKYRCILCRKSMLKACDILCEKEGFDAIGTGEVLAQKASQTLYNLSATHNDLNHPVIHPLLFYDKEEIIKLAEKNNLRVEKHAGACLAVPKYPVTRANPERVGKMFNNAGLQEIIENTLNNVKTLKNPREMG